jgi:hypothetical protein
LLIKQHGKIPEATLHQIVSQVEPLMNYIDGFCSQLFNTISIEEIEHAITHPNDYNKKLESILSVDYTSADSYDGKSLVTGPFLYLRDPAPGTVSAV